MQLTQKIRIFPNEEQQQVLWHLSEQCRLIYNFALAERRKEWELNMLRSDFQVFPWGKPYYEIGYYTQQNKLPLLKQKYPKYTTVNSKVLQMVLRGLNADYKSFFALRKNGDLNTRPPGFKGKNYFTTMVYNQSGFKIQNNTVTLSHKYNKIPLTFTIPEKYSFNKVYQVTVSKDNKKYYLSIVYESPVKPYTDNGIYQAIDLGITKTVIAVNTSGKFLEVVNPRTDKYWNPKIDSLKSRRGHCKKGSRKHKLLHHTIRKCQRKCNNQIKDWQHKLTRTMVDNTKANTIILGDLNVKNMAQSKTATKGLNRSTQNNGYLSRFVRFLTYKAELVGKKVIEIDERNTSKTCYVCGNKHDMPLWNRTMNCDCGNVIDRDRNSSINIMVRFLSQNALWTGYQHFVGNLRKTGLPIPTGIQGVHSQEAICESVG